jgi:hypothetical protein
MLMAMGITVFDHAITKQNNDRVNDFLSMKWNDQTEEGSKTKDSAQTYDLRTNIGLCARLSEIGCHISLEVSTLLAA